LKNRNGGKEEAGCRRRERTSEKGVGGKERAGKICWKKRAGKQFAGKNEREKFAEKNEREWSWQETTSGK
jgi:hypothetical protein